MTFGERVRELRRAKQLTLRELAGRVEVGFTYLSKIENNKLDDGHAPSDKLIHKLAGTLDGDENELMVLANRIPVMVRRRVIERLDAFVRLAHLDDATLDRLIAKARVVGRNAN